MSKEKSTKQEAVETKSEQKPLPPADKKYQELANLNYITDLQARQEIIDIIDEVGKIEGVSMKKSSDHDLTVLYRGKSLARICPLKKDYSASLGGGKIEKHSKSEILKAITKGIAERKEEMEKARIEMEKQAKAEAERVAKEQAEAEAKAQAETEKKKAPSKSKK